MSMPMVKVPGVPESETAIAGMAYFSGTGPEGKTCGDCLHRGYRRESQNGTWNELKKEMTYTSYRVQKCARFKSMTGHHGTDIAADNKCCKYFEAKAK
jgi:hypothetical protein